MDATMRLLSVILTLALIAGPADLVAQQATTELLREAQTLRCVFEMGQRLEWLDGTPVVRPAAPPDAPIVVDRIDRETGRARLIVVSWKGEPLLEDVAVAVLDTGPLPRLDGRSTYGLTFLEVTQAGAVSMITVWSPADPQSLPAEARSYPAAWSWHGALEVPTPEQNPGWCRVEG
jgi:hypothetical protein